jgi:hypothetical protein
MNTRPRKKSKHDPPRLAHIDGTALIIVRPRARTPDVND